MKTNILHGITILGLGAILFGATAMVPAQADSWHRDRDRDRDRDYKREVIVVRKEPIRIVEPIRIEPIHVKPIFIEPVRVNTDFVIYCGYDHRPEGKFWYWSKVDRCWRRDRCR